MIMGFFIKKVLVKVLIIIADLALEQIIEPSDELTVFKRLYDGYCETLFVW